MVFGWLKRLFWEIVAWFQPGEHGTPVAPPPAKEQTEADVYAAGLVLPPALPSRESVQQPKVIRERRVKWLKPKGLEKLAKQEREQRPEAAVERKPKIKRPVAHASDDDPEQWGQFYFRDQVLDQLDIYFTYLKRMRRADNDGYHLHRQLGIQIMPRSAVQTFDSWRDEGQIDELSAWWRTHRPSFGAIAYGADKQTAEDESHGVIDAPPEFFERHRKKVGRPKQATKNRIATITAGSRIVEVAGGIKEREALIWIPKFLYFTKLSRVPSDIQMVKNADVYSMVIYWDRLTGYSKGWHKRHKGGIPQEYALCIDRDSNNIRVLRRQVTEMIKVRSRHGRSGFINIPAKYWTSAADSRLNWAFGRNDASPEGYLIRCFIEAALMFENATLGSMVRIEVKKDNLIATFGVDIKRMSYFFKDRDITLTIKGKRPRIFHIVRPHMRKTKNGEIPVKLTFRGLRKFTWGGYEVNITVPGRDHFSLSEMDIASEQYGEKEKFPRNGMMTNKELGEFLVQSMKDGVGAWRAKERSTSQS